MGEFSGIDPQALHETITSYSGDKDRLRGSAASIKSRFEKYGLDTQPMTEMLGICGWLDDQLPMLKRRQVLAAALEKDPTGLHQVVQVPEPVVSPAQAQADGKTLAGQMNGITTPDGKQYHDIAAQLAAHQDDPDYCSAFYANLQPNVAQLIPSLLANSGSSTAASDLKSYSRALGTAVSDAYPAPGFDKVKKLFTTPPPKGVYVTAWDRGAMLQYGQFPADFLSDMARANVLDSFAKDPNQNFQVTANEARVLDLPDDTVAIYLDALGTNGDAARLALSHMGQTGNATDLPGNLKSLISYTDKVNPYAIDSLKAALTAGSGDKVARDPDGSIHGIPTMHGGDDANFAATAMSQLAQAHVNYASYQDYIAPTFQAYGTPPGVGSDAKGAQDAHLLGLATSGDAKWPPTRPAVAAVAADAESGKDNLDFMRGFYSQGGGAFEAQVATVLHAEDGTHKGQVLNGDSKKILANFGDSLAAATKMSADPDKFQFDITKTFTEPKDMWSTSMLLKYGPSGDKWDSAFLAEMGNAALRWRGAHEMRPSYIPSQINGAGYMPGGFIDPDDAWYSGLGLKEDYITMNMADQTAVAQGIADNDPSLAVLSKLAGNPTASRDLLSGSNGPTAAKVLVNNTWQTPGLSDDESGYPAKILVDGTAKTNDPSADKLAATAAQNVFEAAINDLHTWQGASDFDKEQYPSLPPKLAGALADVAGLYTPDLAKSLNNTAPSPPKKGDPVPLRFTATTDPNHQPIVVSDGNAIDQLIQELMRDPAAGGTYSGYVRAYMTTVAAGDPTGSKGGNDLMRNLGNLDGHIETAKSDAPYTAAQKQDAADTEKQKYTWVVGGVLGAIPIPGLEPGVEVAVGAVRMFIAGGTAAHSYDFGGGHAAAVASQEQANSNSEMLGLQFPILQGLISAKKIATPPDSFWCHDGKLDFDAMLKDPRDYNNWKAQNGIDSKPAYLTLFNAAKDGYGETAHMFATGSDAHKDGH